MIFIIIIILNVKVLVSSFNQVEALVGAFSVIVQPVVEPMEHYTALLFSRPTFNEQFLFAEHNECYYLNVEFKHSS